MMGLFWFSLSPARRPTAERPSAAALQGGGAVNVNALYAVTDVP
jgi:hypothetical protein